MKTFFIIFLNLIFSIFSILPTWDLKKSSIDLLGTEPNTNKEYIIANRVMYELTLTLKKNITRNNGKIYLITLRVKHLTERESAYAAEAVDRNFN